MTRASIIIPAWNGAAYLPACLDALLPQITPADEVIVFDNGSSDGSGDLVSRRYPHVRLLGSKRNLGFAGGCNAGLRAATGKYLLLLNQDVEVRPGWLAALLDALSYDLTLSPVAIAGCKLLYPDGTIQHAGGSLSGPLALPNHFGYREPDYGQWNRRRQVTYVTGAAIALRRQYLEAIGLFDEGFFPAFYEEADLCARAREAGYQVIYVPEAVAVHHEGSSIEREGIDYHRYMGRGRLRFVLKHSTPEQFFDEFVPAERRWLATLPTAAMGQGMRLAYADTLRSITALAATGTARALPDQASLARAREALAGLKWSLVGPVARASAGEMLAWLKRMLILRSAFTASAGQVLARLKRVLAGRETGISAADVVAKRASDAEPSSSVRTRPGTRRRFFTSRLPLNGPLIVRRGKEQDEASPSYPVSQTGQQGVTDPALVHILQALEARLAVLEAHAESVTALQARVDGFGRQMADVAGHLARLHGAADSDGVRLEDIDAGLLSVDREVTRLHRELAELRVRLRAVGQRSEAGSQRATQAAPATGREAGSAAADETRANMTGRGNQGGAE